MRIFALKIVGFLYNLYLRFITRKRIRLIKGEYHANTKYVREHGGHGVAVIEFLPTKRMIYSNSLPGLPGLPVCLYFPYMYFLIYYVESQHHGLGKGYFYCTMKIGLRQSPANHTLDKVGDSMLKNHTGSFSYCLGSANEPRTVFKSVRELSEAAIKAFWATSFESFDQIWAKMTKDGTGEVYIKQTLDENKAIEDLIHLKENEHDKKNGQKFFYQTEARQSGDGSDRS